jgi:UDP-N-acetylmuramate dehydrogenase
MSIVEELEEAIGRGRMKTGEPMAAHVLSQKGGPAEFYIEIDKTIDLIKIIQKARALGLPLFVYGSGSKCMIPDRGINGLVIKNNCHRFEKASVRGSVKENQIDVEDVLLYAESGAIVNQVVRFSIEEGLEGLEYQLGLPGTIGGAIYTNARYKPKNIYLRSHLYSMKILGVDGDVQLYVKELPHFVTFEDELFQTKEVILSVTFKLLPGEKKILWERGEEAGKYRSTN